jgi:hypothetical protein
MGLEGVKINVEALGKGEQMRKDPKLEGVNRLCQRLGHTKRFCSEIKLVEVSFFFPMFLLLF